MLGLLCPAVDRLHQNEAVLETSRDHSGAVALTLLEPQANFRLLCIIAAKCRILFVAYLAVGFAMRAGGTLAGSVLRRHGFPPAA